MGELELERSKVLVAEEACRIINNMKNLRIIGLGTGSTVRRFIDICSHTLRGLKAVVSSVDTAVYAKQHGIEVLDILSVENIDLSIDGADEVTIKLDLVKGRGAALLREKTIAHLSQTRIYIVDYTKYTGLDYIYTKLIPIEVVPFTLGYVLKTIKNTGLFEVSLRTSTGKDGPVVTDNGNFIVDLKLLKPVSSPRDLHYYLKSIHGVVETGIFPSADLVDIVVVGYPDKARVLKREGTVD